MIDPSDIKSILQEPDGEELYRTATEVKRAMTHHSQAPEVDVDAEWKKFAAVHTRRKSLPLRAVAASVALVVCFVVAAITLPKFIGHQAVEETEPVALSADMQTETETFVFHDVSLGEVLNELAAYYEVNVICQNRQLLDIHLYTQIDKSLTLTEVLSLLNHFDNVNIRLEGETLIVDE